MPSFVPKSEIDVRRPLMYVLKARRRSLDGYFCRKVSVKCQVMKLDHWVNIETYPNQNSVGLRPEYRIFVIVTKTPGFAPAV